MQTLTVYVLAEDGRSAEDVATALHNLVVGLEGPEDVTGMIWSVDASPQKEGA